MATAKDRYNDLCNRYTEGDMKLQEFRTEAKRDIEFYLNKQFSDTEEEYLASENRECIVNNKIRRNISLISGYQRMNQLSSIVIPQCEKYQEDADIVSDAVQYLYMQRNGYNHLADCFLYGTLISGVNFSEIVLDYTHDSNVPDIRFVRIPYNAVVFDPYFTETDLSDCSYILRRRLMSKHSVLGLLPDYASDIKKFKRFDGDGMFLDMPQVTNPNGQEQLAYTEMWEQDTEKRSILIDAKTGARIDLIRKGQEKNAEYIVAMNPELRIERRTIPTVKLNIFINEEFIERVDDPLGINDYPFVPFMGIYTPEHDDFRYRLQSVLRVSRDPQSELNKRISKFIDILDSKIHSGWIFKKKALADGEDPYNAGNNRNLAIKNDAVIGQDIAQVSPSPTDPSLMQSFSLFDNNIMESMGLTDASFGEAQGGNDSGLLVMLRQQTAALGLQGLFDNFYLSQTIHTRKTLLTMFKNWPNWKWELVTGRDNINYRFRDTAFAKYNINISQGVLTENQQKMYFAQLVQMRQLGINIPDSIMIKEAPIQKKSKLLKDIAAIEKAQAEQAQKVQELQQQQMAIENAKTISETRENEADTVRANARAIADVGLTAAHISEATQRRSRASLDLVKASQEMIGEDQRQLIEAMNFIDSITNAKLAQNSRQLLFDKEIVDSYKGNQQQIMTQEVVGQV